MRFALFAIVAPMLAAPALARPPIAARQVADPCAGIGADAVDTLPGTFTLATLNTTLPNANTTGAPLTLGQDGVTTGAAAYSFSVRAFAAPLRNSQQPLMTMRRAYRRPTPRGLISSSRASR